MFRKICDRKFDLVKNQHGKKAFTILELLIVIAIMGIMTVVVTFNYRGASQSQNTRTAAGELLSTLREAQIWGTSSRTFPLNVVDTEEHATRFDRGYGVRITKNSNQFVLYGGWDGTWNGTPGNGDVTTYDPGNTAGPGGGNQQLVRAEQFTGDIVVTDIQIDCGEDTDACGNSDIGYVDVHFKRPNLGPIITEEGGGGSTSSVVLTLRSPQSDDYEETVVIWKSGVFYAE